MIGMSLWRLVKTNNDGTSQLVYEGLEPLPEHEALLETSEYTVNYKPTHHTALLTKESIKNLSDTEIEQLLDSSLAYPYRDYQEFISGLAHYMKSYGDEHFILTFCTEQVIEECKQYGRLNFCYLIALLDYLHTKHHLKHPSFLSNYESIAMEQVIFEEGDIVFYKELGNLDILNESLENAIETFLRYNLVITPEAFEVT